MYQQSENSIIRDSDNAVIPLDPTIPEYQEYLAWLAQGNAPPPYVPPPPPPPILPIVRFRLNLLAAGYLEQVEAFMAGPVATLEQKILWEYSTEVSRDDPTLAALAEALGFTEAQIDEVFKQL